jgi:type II secretion system protein J
MSMQLRPCARPWGGFTLIEMLVALLILGIMSALGYGTYRAARISAERTEESLSRSRNIEFGMRMIVMDFAQMVPRPVRDPPHTGAAWISGQRHQRRGRRIGFWRRQHVVRQFELLEHALQLGPRLQFEFQRL